MAFADEIKRVAPRYFVQTPNRHFPIEQHVLMPFFQYVPKPLARKALRRFTVRGWIEKPSQGRIDNFVDNTRLLTVAEMKELFPDADIVRERVCGLIKSVIAIKL